MPRRAVRLIFVLVLALTLAPCLPWGGLDGGQATADGDGRTHVAVRAHAGPSFSAVRLRDAGPRGIPCIETARAQILPPLDIATVDDAAGVPLRREPASASPIAARAPPLA